MTINAFRRQVIKYNVHNTDRSSELFSWQQKMPAVYGMRTAVGRPGAGQLEDALGQDSSRTPWGRTAGGRPGAGQLEDALGQDSSRTPWGRTAWGCPGAGQLEDALGQDSWRTPWGRTAGGRPGAGHLEDALGQDSWRTPWGRTAGGRSGAGSWPRLSRRSIYQLVVTLVIFLYLVEIATKKMSKIALSFS